MGACTSGSTAGVRAVAAGTRTVAAFPTGGAAAATAAGLVIPAATS
jgi:hypothetical protein